MPREGGGIQHFGRRLVSAGIVRFARMMTPRRIDSVTLENSGFLHIGQHNSNTA